MAPSKANQTVALALSLLLLLLLPSFSLAASPTDCGVETEGTCHNKPKALRLKVIAIAVILIASMMGVCLPLVTKSVPALHPDRNLFVVVKAFASGVILATGYMHVLPDSFDDLRSPCLADKPWHQFPFTTFIAMLAALLTLMVDSLMLTFYNRNKKGSSDVAVVSSENPATEIHGHGHCHGGAMEIVSNDLEGNKKVTLQRNRVIAQVLELGIVVHSVVIGLGVGASQDVCMIRPLVAALCFHQFFEGMGLGGCILQAEYHLKMKSILAFFFSVTTPFGIALGIALSNIYRDGSPTALIVVGVLNAASAGLLNYTALVDLLAADFLGPRLQGNVKLQLVAFSAVLLGAGGMSLMAKWA
ncbi:fe(2+) transport protein 1-like protein [Carex littledalei]|uniref:Fe(2+) transport protein 1-like protein n=1 Tax=Carex littledalei TaxID=544730 RepID=A0A833R5P3_9POAL|nr:fe(2+) transport protein 1-like protein [Carex littledalei]